MRSILLPFLFAAFTMQAIAGGSHHKPPPQAAQRPVDTWDGAPAHLVVSAGFGVVCATHVFPGEPAKAFGCAMVPGLIKETIDSTQAGNRFSARDMVANAVGAAAGVYLGGFMLRRSNGTTQIAYATSF